MKSNKQTSRRKFLKQAAVASSVFIVPRQVLGGVGFTAPSDQLNLAAVGIGGKGRTDIIHATVKGRERVVALCDVDPRGKHGVARTRKDFPKANFYTDFRQMLDQEKDIDAVTISGPDHMHAHAAVAAMERGMHVYVQKPLTHNIKEARLLTEMANQKKVVTQMGNQGASDPSQKTIQKWIAEGSIGPISRVYVWTDRPIWPQGIPPLKPQPNLKPEGLEWDLWLGPAPETPFVPKMHPFNWRGWWAYGTGALGDMGCHLIDIPFRALGLKYPTQVECSVGSVYTRMWEAEHIPEGCPPSSYVTINFEPTERNSSPVEMIWMDGGIRPARPALVPANDDFGGTLYSSLQGGSNGVVMEGKNGVIVTDCYGQNPRLYHQNGSTKTYGRPSDQPSFPENGHQYQWIDACKAGFGSTEHRNLTSSFDYAGPLTETVLMGNLAIRSYNLRRKKLGGSYEYYGRKKLTWDGQNMQITNLKEANRFVGRDYRKGWEI